MSTRSSWYVMSATLVTTSNWVNYPDWCCKVSGSNINRSMWKNQSLIRSQDIKAPPNRKNSLATTCSMYYRITPGQYTRMTFEKWTRACNIRSHMWSPSDLNGAQCRHFSQYQQVKLLKTRFRWEIGGKPCHFCRHSFVTEPDLAFFAKVAQNMPHKS